MTGVELLRIIGIAFAAEAGVAVAGAWFARSLSRRLGRKEGRRA